MELSGQVKDCSENPRHCGGNGGCEGSTSELAYDYIVKHGVSLDERYGGDKNMDEHCGTAKPYIKLGGRGIRNDYNCNLNYYIFL